MQARGQTDYMNQLELIFSELGISHYLGAFVDQGFDSWETILDITESDLDALGVKLGHRRKLQRRIANYRGLQVPITTLVSPTRTSIEDAPVNGNQAAQPEPKDGTSSTKRKYRRHPKADENAPERPPSAYVLFSNKMREDLKGQNLTFTEIAKLVGENWQNLDRHEKEPYETQAQEAKERYSREMSEYKKTPEYQKYCDYLQEFRKRQATQDKDAAKRIKTDAENNYRGSSTGTPMASNGVASAGSTSDSQHGSEPPPSRRQRMDSGASGSEARDSPNTNTRALQTPPEQVTHSPRRASGEDASSTRPRGLSSPGGQEGPAVQPHRRPSTLYDTRLSSEGPAPSIFPSLSAAVQPPPPSHSPESLASSVPSLPVANSSGHASGGSNFWSRPPSLRTEQSSTGSISSLASYSAPRTPSEASLPIHALLSSKPDPFPAMQPQLVPSPAAHDVPGPLRPTYPMHQHPGHHGGDARPYMNNSMSPTQTPAAAGQERRASIYATGSVAHLPPPMPLVQTLPNPLKDKARPSVVSRPAGASPDVGLDGMSALLRASDIVGRGNV